MSSFLPIVLSLALLLCLTGCDGRGGTVSTDSGPSAEPAMVPVDQAARQLGLYVVRMSAYSARLENGQNVVYLMTRPNPGVMVNGQQVDDGRRLRSTSGQIWMPPELMGRLAGSLRQAPPPVAVVRPVTPAPVPSARPAGPLTGVTVLIDPGHGGDDPGALYRFGGRDAMNEKDINLDTALRLRQVLQDQGVHVVMTRQTDVFIELDDRVAIANRVKPDLFVSIHADSAANGEAQGFTVYVARDASSASVAAANAVVAALKPACLASRDLRRADYRVLAKTTCPAMLIELGFLTNRQEARQLTSPTHRQRLAQAIAAGVTRYAATSTQVARTTASQSR